MGETTKIGWTDHTFNAWIGCTEVSPECDNCYAKTLSERYGWAEWGAGKPRHRTSAANWKKPLAWNRKAAAEGIRRRVFSNSLADVFDVEVSDEWRADLMALIEATPALDWLLLTKRPKVMAQYFAGRKVPDNVWALTTVGTQKMADLRIPDLLKVKARVRGLSVEPMLEAVDFHDKVCRETGSSEDCPQCFSRLDWVICGGESGDRARPLDPLWVRSIRDQCRRSATAFFFKQWGGRTPDAGGKILDGREHCEFPTPPTESGG